MGRMRAPPKIAKMNEAKGEGMRGSEFLTTKELAGRLGVSQRTVQGWAKNGTGPKQVKLGGGTVRYRLIDVEAWEKRNERGGEK